jgi:hypothetical protein
LEYIDEVLLFSGKALLWEHIQEEVFSLHKRYSPPKRRPEGNSRSIDTEVLRRILEVMSGVYNIEIGWKRNVEGTWKSDYKLSIPESSSPTTRLTTFQSALSVLPHPLPLNTYLIEPLHVRVYSPHSPEDSTYNHTYHREKIPTHQIRHQTLITAGKDNSRCPTETDFSVSDAEEGDDG